MTLLYCILALNLGFGFGAWWSSRHRQDCRGRECGYRQAAIESEYELEALKAGIVYRPGRWVM